MKKEQIKVKEQRIACSEQSAKSLHFLGDELIDLVGWNAYAMDGSVRRHDVHVSYVLDAAAMSADGRYVLLHERLGTKGVLFKDGDFVREINRSYYQAHRYDYPVALFTLPDGRGVIAHCPDEYNRLEIDEIDSGKRLTASTVRDPMDMFHSRLAASPDGRFLIDAGWVWHPADELVVFDVEAALADPATLDSEGLGISLCGAANSFNACFDRNGVMAAVETGTWNPQVQKEDHTTELAIYGLDNPRFPSIVPLDTPAGDLMPVGEGHVLVLSDIPRLLDRMTGQMVQEWPQYKLAVRTSAITWRGTPSSVYALDTAGQRCAIAQESELVVLQFERNFTPAA